MPITGSFPNMGIVGPRDGAVTAPAPQSAAPGTALRNRVGRRALYKPALIIAAAASVPAAAAAATPAACPGDIESRVGKLVPELERYVARGMAVFDVPGAAVGIVNGDRLLYGRGFGRRLKGGSETVGTRTVFQIGSTTKAIGAAVLALAVDRHKLNWDDRVADLYPSFALADPWVTREFRVYDLLAQRSGLPPYANDLLSELGFDAGWLVHSLRFVEPVTSFRSTFTYTNITHLLAGQIIAKALNAPDWPAVAEREIVGPLGMRDTTFTAEAIEKAPDHATGHRWTPGGSTAIPFTPLFPYAFGLAGDLNASVEDCARWVRFQIGNGSFGGRRLVSEANLAVTRTPLVSLKETVAYAMGWVVTDTPNGRVVWHNGGTGGFGAHIGFQPTRGFGAIVLSNQANMGFADAVGLWIQDRLLGNPETDYMKAAHTRATEAAAKAASVYRKRAGARPAPAVESLVGEYRGDPLGAATLSSGAGLLLTLRETGARLNLVPFDGALFTVHLLPEGKFAAVASGRGGEPLGFAGFEADADGRLSRLYWIIEGQKFLLTRI